MFYANYEKACPQEYPRPEKGAALFFALLFDQWWPLCRLNLLFVLCSLPLVTLFPALQAMSAVTSKMACDEVCDLGHDFKTAFKRSFFPALGSGTLLLLGLTAAATALWFYWTAWQVGRTSYLVFCGMLPVALWLGVTAVHLFPLPQCVRIGRHLAMAAVKGLLFFLRSLFCLVLLAAAAYLTVKYPFWAIPFLFFAGFSFLSFTFSYITRNCKITKRT